MYNHKEAERVIRRIALFSITKNRYPFIVCSLLLILSMLMSGCNTQVTKTIISTPNINTAYDVVSNTQSYPKSRIDKAMQIEYEKSSFEKNHQIKETTIAVVGDLMFHNTQLMKAYDAQTQSFDFSSIFSFVKPYLQEPDLLFGNLETTFYGPYGSTTSMSEQNVYGYSGYPMFNTPESALDAIDEAGFDFLSTANNHALDKRLDGLLRTITQLDKRSIQHTGTYSSVESKKPYEVTEANGVTFAVVNYTYATNGIILRDEDMLLINTLNNYEAEAIEQLYRDVDLAVLENTDFVIVMMHYGNEYKGFEDKTYQRAITENLLRHGADIVFGGHPHVLQPIEIYTELDDKPLDEPKIVIYSLGNFIASQRNVNKIGGNTDLGVVFHLYFEQIDALHPKITGIGFIPTYTTWQTDTIMTIPINDTYSWNTEENYLYGKNMLSSLVLTDWDKTRIEFAKGYTLNHLMTYEAEKKTLGEQYYDEGVYRYDLNK